MKISKKIYFSFIFIIFTLLSTSNKVLADTWGSEDEPAKFEDLNTIFSNILGILVPLAGIAVFVMIIIGGFAYMTSGGNPEKNAKAGATLTWAVVGLLFLLGAWFILRFVKDFTGIDVTIFKAIQ